MFMEERQAKILEMLSKDGKVLVKELAETFEVTEDSIRKDLSTLEAEGKLRRTYGGAVPILESLKMTEANKRRMLDVEAKRKIARAAVKMISPQDLVFLDTSTISIAIAEILAKSGKSYKILTSMVDVLVMLAVNPNIEIIFGGGQINKSRDGFCDVLCREFISHFRPDVAFIGVVGADFKKNSLTTNGIDGGSHKAKVISLSKKNFIVAESRKLGMEGKFSFANFDKISGVITETEPAKEILSAAKDLGIEIILPE